MLTFCSLLHSEDNSCCHQRIPRKAHRLERRHQQRHQHIISHVVLVGTLDDIYVTFHVICPVRVLPLNPRMAASVVRRMGNRSFLRT